MNDALHRQLIDLLGAPHLEVTPAGFRVTPPSLDALAAVMGFANEAGLRVAVAGMGSWQDADPRGQLIVSTRALDSIDAVAIEDFHVTAGGGATVARIAARARDAGTFLALDPPGLATRSLGSVLATATSGPLQHRFGPARDQLLGLTVVTGDGRIVRTGGTTVKNVAGFDLMKLQVGGFGAFGILASCTLRLRAHPVGDRTFVLQGPRDRLTAAARALAGTSLEAAAFELLSPGTTGSAPATLAVRLLGEPAIMASQQALLDDAADGWEERPAEWWETLDRLMTDPDRPVSLRFGALPAGLDSTLDLLHETLPDGVISAGAQSGAIRWSGRCEADVLRQLRIALAAREIPMTVERAPWPLRSLVGHFGAYREGVGGIVARLRDVFDPRGTLQTAIDAGSAA